MFFEKTDFFLNEFIFKESVFINLMRSYISNFIRNMLPHKYSSKMLNTFILILVALGVVSPAYR